VHPTTRLIVWVFMLVALQCLDGALLAAVVLMLPLVGGPTLRRWGRLVWGARWFFLSLFVILAWGGAGEPVWSGPLAPTREGLADALTHLGRLLLVLMAVALLRERMALRDLLTATRRLLEPLRRLGVDPDHALVRLLLVLRHLETMPRPRDWRLLLDAPTSSTSEVFEIADCHFSWVDYVIAVVVVVAGTVTLFYLGQA
jgi:energy-coupling factor transporter transmembrane protein EcfT